MVNVLTRCRLALVALLALLAAAPATLRAQTIRGVVVDPNNRPIPGVVVLLLDSTSATTARALSNARGEYRLTAPRGGSYRVRTMRIGFRSVTSDAVVLAAGREVSGRVVVSGLAISLDTVRVVNQTACRMVADSAAATYAVWEQVRTALTAAQLTDSIDATTLTYQRTLDPSARRIWKQAYAISSEFVRRPWESMSPDSLHRIGYVTTAGDWTSYFAPGLDALLSESFAEDHCVHLATGSDPTRIGIAFEPSPLRRSLPEIRGTLWVDRATSELRRMEFSYVNVPRVRQEQAGGEMEFARMRGGQWAISRWNIRMPVLLLGLSSGSEARVEEVRVTGGELSLARHGADTLWSRPPLNLAGTVSDSTSGAALPGARISLGGTALRAVSDSTGRFTMSGVLPGEYVLNVRTPSLDSVGAVIQTALVFTDSAKLYSVRVPTAQQIAAGICGNTRGDYPGIILGSVEVSGDSLPRGNVRVLAEWDEAVARNEPGPRRTRWLETRTDARGRYRLCGIPVNVALLFRANADSLRAEPIDMRIPENNRFARADLTMERSNGGSAVFAGTVLADSTQLPIVDAEVSMPGLTKRTTTNDRGAFRVLDIPAGEQQVVVRHVGFGPLDTKIAFDGLGTVERQVLLRRASRLDTVVIADRSTPQSFEEHRKIGLGVFITHDELQKQQGRRLSEVLGDIQGLAVMTGGMGNAYLASKRSVLRIPSGLNPNCGDKDATKCVQAADFAGGGVWCPETFEEKVRGMTCACYSQVYMDKVLLNPQQSSFAVDGKAGRATPPFDINSIRTDNIEAVEYYRSASETPGMYAQMDGSCGVLVLWTHYGNRNLLDHQ